MIRRAPTPQARAVARALLESPDPQLWGYDICLRVELTRQVVYGILGRFEADGWITAAWEEQEGNEARPRRRYWSITEEGRIELERMSQEVVA